MRSLLVPAAAVSAAASQVTPVQKVVELLSGMLSHGKDEKHAEQVTFSAYKQWCDDTILEKENAIADADHKIEKLAADIGKFASDADQLVRQTTALTASIGGWEADEKAATKVRTTEKSDYQTTHKDYSESLDALGRAINVLKQQNFDRKQATEALLEVRALGRLPAKGEAAISTYLAQVSTAQDPFDVAAPDAHAYEFQSSSVIDLLEKLKGKFADERDSLHKEEVNKQHAFELLVQDLKAQVTSATGQRQEKTVIRAKKMQRKADAEGELADTRTVRADDSAFLADTRATCSQKANDFDSRQALRAEEIQTLEQAIDILSGSRVQGAAERHLPAVLLDRSRSAFVQLRSAQRRLGQVPETGRAAQRAADFIRDAASRTDSPLLATLSDKISMSMATAAQDPFSKVKQMINDLIVRLMAEESEEAQHEAWCKRELEVNEMTRTTKTQQVEGLKSEIESLDAKIQQHAAEIADKSSKVAELDRAVAEASKIRETEHNQNTGTVKDAQDAQTAVTQAVTVLRQFYDKAGQATALVQSHAPQPAIFDSPYQGMGAASGGVLGLLEVIESDFARLESETSASEAQADSEHQRFLSDSAVDKAATDQSIEHLSRAKQSAAQSLVSRKNDLEGTQTELNAALEYYDQLKPSCIDAGVSYEERVARRQEEIESLQEALKILNGEDLSNMA